MSLRIATNTVDAVLDQYQRDLSPFYPRGEVRAITCAVFHDKLGWDASELLLRRGSALSESELLKVYLPLKRLRSGEPLQYVLGHVEFHGLHIGVAPGVLIPRPETEELVDLIVRAAKFPPQRIVDIGTGSGCIALALKRSFPGAEVVGVDVSPGALAIARANAARNQLEVTWVQADVRVDAVTTEPIDLLVSNPPYVPRAEEPGLAEHVRAHEPHLALFVDGPDPLLFYRAIAGVGLAALTPGAAIWFEGHHVHSPAVGDLLKALGYLDVRVLTDLSGAPRFITGVRP